MYFALFCIMKKLKDDKNVTLCITEDFVALSLLAAVVFYLCDQRRL